MTERNKCFVSHLGLCQEICLWLLKTKNSSIKESNRGSYLLSPVSVIWPDRTGHFYATAQRVSLTLGTATNLSAPFVLISSQWDVPATGTSAGITFTRGSSTLGRWAFEQQSVPSACHTVTLTLVLTLTWQLRISLLLTWSMFIWCACEIWLTACWKRRQQGLKAWIWD